MDELRGERRSPRSSSRLAVPLPVATAGCAVLVLAWAATASPSIFAAPSATGIQIVSSPRAQTLETRLVGTVDSKHHARRPTLVFPSATFTITVSNPGIGTLVAVGVRAPRSPDCERRIGTLAPGASVTYTCSSGKVLRSYTNVVSVSARYSSYARIPTGVRAVSTASAASSVRLTAKVVAVAGVPSFTG